MGDVQSLEDDLPKYAGNKNLFLKRFLDDVARQARQQKSPVSCFILEEKPGDYWLGATADPAESQKWHYAMGSFLFSFGARAETLFPNVQTGQSGAIKSQYKVYIYDRYNWDIGKDVKLPKRQVDAIDMATPGSIEALKELELPFEGGKKYIGTVTEKVQSSKRNG